MNWLIDAQLPPRARLVIADWVGLVKILNHKVEVGA
jgi:hypothetical protein